MRKNPFHWAIVCPFFFILFLTSFSVSAQEKQADLPVQPKIQVALLLDVSTSMNGLIEQTKDQLWNMVNILGRATCEGKNPPIEIALYEYGRPANDSLDGFVKQILPFTKDMDKIFTELITLTTDGGKEYCGHVLYNALTRLTWDTLATSYKVIFISGNESFQQGSVSYLKACEVANKRGIIINTIYCESREEQSEVRQTWEMGASCGCGSFSIIDQNAKPLSIPTPFDDSIITLKERLNETFIVYGERGKEYLYSMRAFDTAATMALNDPNKVVQYVVTRANNNLYNYIAWDLVYAMEKDSSVTDKVDMKTLDDSLSHKSRSELKEIVNQTLAKRKKLQAIIKELALKQEEFIIKEKEKLAVTEQLTLESEIEKIIKSQIMRFNMKIK